MPVRYSKQQAKTGASIGTIISVPKPSTWTTSNNPTTEGNRWNINANYPGWLECDGRTLNVSDYIALYEVLGNSYGGTPGSTFKLPDYRSKKLMGTGTVDSNSSIAPSLTPNSAPEGKTPSIDQPGSEGGQYTVSTIRQLPPGSEITPESPLKPDVFFDVSDPVLGVNVSFVTGVAYQNYGTGKTEVGGFAEPPITNKNKFIGFGTIGTSPFNSTQYSREIRYQNLNLTGYSFVRIYAIAGNDSNGGERVNNVGEGLRIVWPNGSESVILPSSGDVGGAVIFDPIYTAWRELQVEIPIQYRTTGVTIRFRQDLNTSTNNPPGAEQRSSVPVGSHPNSFDCIGIQRIGFLGGEIGGESSDTFTIGTYSTSGFGDITDEATPNFSGNVNYTIGDSNSGTGTRRVTGIFAHFHEHAVCKVARGKLSIANGPGGTPNIFDQSKQPYYGRSDFRNGAVISIYAPRTGSVRTYDRDGEPVRSHSHMLAFESSAVGRQTIGNSETSGNLVNSLDVGGNTSNTSFNVSSNIGNQISKNLNIVNDLGVDMNPGTITLTNSSRTAFDNSLSVRLQAAEEITLMSPYFRLKYIIKAY
jgi:hypothetical protein